ncbi:MAG: Crp/Fnr family transcriptional regulator [Pseudonocardiaceae bacterium]
MTDRVTRQVSEALRESGRLRPFHRGEFLMRSGERSDEVLVIESGAVKVVLATESGVESILGLYGPGELIGELGVMSGQPRSATVIAHLDGVALHVPGAPFLRLREQDREICAMVDDTLRRRLHNADRRQLAIASLDVPTRVAAQLLALAKAYGVPAGTGLVVRGFTHRDLAQVVTASEKTVDAALKLLRSSGLLETERCRYLLPDPALLEHLLGQPGWRPGT